MGTKLAYRRGQVVDFWSQALRRLTEGAAIEGPRPERRGLTDAERADFAYGNNNGSVTREQAQWAVKERPMRGKNLMLDVETVLDRAERLIDTGRYSLTPGENGGADPEADWPYYLGRPNGTADCVGAGMWIQGMDRYQPQVEAYGGWVNTNSIFLMPGLFVSLGQDFDLVQPGDILAYPSYRDLLGRRRYGHWMTLYEVPRAARRLKDLTVIHCAQKAPPATRATWGFAKGKPKDWAFFRPLHRMGLV